MKFKYALLSLAALGMFVTGLSARGDSANTVPMQDLKIVEEKGAAIAPVPDADEVQQGGEENMSGYYYRPYRPYYRPYYSYYRPYYRYYYAPTQPGGEQPDLQNLPGPQVDQPEAH